MQRKDLRMVLIYIRERKIFAKTGVFHVERKPRRRRRRRFDRYTLLPRIYEAW